MCVTKNAHEGEFNQSALWGRIHSLCWCDRRAQLPDRWIFRPGNEADAIAFFYRFLGIAENMEKLWTKLPRANSPNAFSRIVNPSSQVTDLCERELRFLLCCVTMNYRLNFRFFPKPFRICFMLRSYVSTYTWRYVVLSPQKFLQKFTYTLLI